MFEDVDPAAVLEKRVNEESGHTEWLVKFEDEEEVRAGLVWRAGRECHGNGRGVCWGLLRMPRRSGLADWRSWRVGRFVAGLRGPNACRALL